MRRRRASRRPAKTPRRSGAPEPLELRSRPVQARGQATFDRILEATSRLLEEVGLERLTTNMIAAEAGANIATLYKYFPNKHAVMVALFERQTEARTRGMREAIAALAHAEDWEAVIGRMLDQAKLGRERQHGSSVLRRAMRTTPELLAVEEERDRALADALAAQLAARTGLPRARARVVARVVVEAGSAVFDLWEATGHKDPALVRETRVLLRAYLKTYLGASAGRARGAASAGSSGA